MPLFSYLDQDKNSDIFVFSVEKVVKLSGGHD